MSEREIVQHFGTRVDAPYQPITLESLLRCERGLSKEIRNEKYPERAKMLRTIRREIKSLINELL